METISGSRNVSTAEVALNWLLQQRGVTSLIIGARNRAQLEENLAAADWRLSPDELRVLDTASALPLPYPYWHQAKYNAERLHEISERASAD
jgi:aryl-alcohol dehydrogenase-like predicted oxidoreductase